MHAKNIFEAILRYGHDEDFVPTEGDSFQSTDAPAGSPEKIEVLRRRVELGQPLWHSTDRVDYEGLLAGFRPYIDTTETPSSQKKGVTPEEIKIKTERVKQKKERAAAIRLQCNTLIAQLMVGVLECKQQQARILPVIQPEELLQLRLESYRKSIIANLVNDSVQHKQQQARILPVIQPEELDIIQLEESKRHTIISDLIGGVIARLQQVQAVQETVPVVAITSELKSNNASTPERVTPKERLLKIAKKITPIIERSRHTKVTYGINSRELSSPKNEIGEIFDSRVQEACRAARITSFLAVYGLEYDHLRKILDQQGLNEKQINALFTHAHRTIQKVN